MCKRTIKNCLLQTNQQSCVTNLILLESHFIFGLPLLWIVLDDSNCYLLCEEEGGSIYGKHHHHQTIRLPCLHAGMPCWRTLQNTGTIFESRTTPWTVVSPRGHVRWQSIPDFTAVRTHPGGRRHPLPSRLTKPNRVNAMKNTRYSI